MAKPRKIRDPVHGFVQLTQKEAQIVDTPVFQRLRGIRQLAFADLVYPGAVHTRFEHSLGVCHLAGLMAEILNLSDEQKRLVRLAALLHDLGHGPFSHASEKALDLFADREKLGDRADTADEERIHELLTADLIRSDSDLKRLIGESDCDRIAKILSEGYEEPVLKAIVSGPLDADKQDYLLRDSHFCGVKYGVFDIDRLHHAFCKITDPLEESVQLSISPDGIYAVEQFVLAKYYLGTQVYSHRVRMITDEMLLRAIKLGVELDNIPQLRELYAYDGSEEFLKEYIKWDDARFLLTYTDDRYKGNACHNLLTRLRQRRLLKRVYDLPLCELPVECSDLLMEISKRDNQPMRSRLENRLWETIRARGARWIDPACDDSRYVIVRVYKVKSLLGEGEKEAEGPILVDRKPEPRTFEEESVLFHYLREGLTKAFVDVYAPVVYETRTERRDLVASLRDPLRKVLADWSVEEGEGP